MDLGLIICWASAIAAVLVLCSVLSYNKGKKRGFVINRGQALEGTKTLPFQEYRVVHKNHEAAIISELFGGKMYYVKSFLFEDRVQAGDVVAKFKGMKDTENSDEDCIYRFIKNPLKKIE